MKHGRHIDLFDVPPIVSIKVRMCEEKVSESRLFFGLIVIWAK